MIPPEIFAQIGPIGILLIAGLLVYLKFGPDKARHEESTGKLDNILKQVTEINGRVGKLEEWRDGHVLLVNERERHHADAHTDIRNQAVAVRGEVQSIRSELSVAAARQALNHVKT